MGEARDERLMAALERDEAYRVERVLASTAAGSTEVVVRPDPDHLGEGPLVRKRIGGGLANIEVFSRLSRAASPHLPRVVETYALPDQLVVVREYVYGASVADCVGEAGRMGEVAAARVVVDVCDAVSDLHELGVVHRDVSPKNVLLSPRGAVLIDLGIARAYVDGARQDTTRLGTWGFASPEQYGFAQTDGRSDVYSIGCLLGYMLTGMAPDADGYAAALADPTLVRPELRRVVEKACSFEPGDRHQSATALRDAVTWVVPEAAARGRSWAPTAGGDRRGTAYRLVRPAQMREAFLAAGAGGQVLSVILMVVGVLVGLLFVGTALFVNAAMSDNHPLASSVMTVGVGIYLTLLLVEEAPAAILGAGPYSAMKYRCRMARLGLLAKRVLLGLALLAGLFVLLLILVALTPGR